MPTKADSGASKTAADKDKPNTAAAPPADTRPAAATKSTADPKQEAEPAAPVKVRSTCVVRSDFHVGNAVAGSKVCSYHTMHYDRNGHRR